MTDETVDGILAGFVARKRRLGTPDGAFDRCRATSTALARSLETAGFEARIVRLSNAVAAFPDAHPKWRSLGGRFFWTHYAVLVEGQVVDCTARQFDPTSDFPSIRPFQDAITDWSEVEVWTLEALETMGLPVPRSEWPSQNKQTRSP